MISIRLLLFARSSLRRMLTKLYGGQGPVYLKVSLSNRAPISFTRWSKAALVARDQERGFMIIFVADGFVGAGRDATS